MRRHWLEYSRLSTSLTPPYTARDLPVPPGYEPVVPISKEETAAYETNPTIDPRRARMERATFK